MVQIASVKNHEVDGTFEMVEVDQNGKTNAVSRALSGRVADGVLNLSIENTTGIGLATATMTDDGMKLTLFANGASQQIALKRRSASDFASAENELRRTAAQYQQDAQAAEMRRVEAKNLEAEQGRINRLVGDITDRITLTADDAAKLDGVIQGYRTAAIRSGRLKALKAHIAATAGSNDVRIGGLDMASEQTADSAISMHGQVVAVTQRIQQALHDRAEQATVLQTECAAKPALDCTNLNRALATYHQHVTAFLQASAREGAAYRAEASNFAKPSSD